MQFEELQKVWDTQNERPVFAMDDARLSVALYQQREQRGRRIFRREFAPIYFTLPLLIFFSGFVLVAFYFKTASKMRMTDPRMTIWDGVALVIATVASIAIMVFMHAEHRRHKRTQHVFAPSLREELERGISQVDFELSLYSTPRVLTLIALVTIGAGVILWESGRLNGNSTSWGMLGYNLVLMIVSTWWGLAAKNKSVERVMQRRRALESMLAALQEGATDLER
ncbi:MAG: hypothetical protein ABIR70_18195 [Bryobacteraceae bacterium]